jgi:hypothetical protein
MKQVVKSVEKVKAILKEHKEEESRKYKVREIGIFGSFVCGEQKREAISTSSLNSIREISRAFSRLSRWSGIWRSFSGKRLTSSEKAAYALSSGKSY